MTRVSQAFSVGSVAVSLEGGYAALVHKLWSRFFVLGAEEKQAGEGVCVRLQLRTEPLPSASGHTVYQAKALLVTRTKTGFALSCGASQLHVTPGSADAPGFLADCFLAPDFGTYSPFEQREFFLLGLLMLLRPFGRYGLHACGLERHGTGLLLVGASGSGKTTTSLNLIRQGWRYLSDDAVLLMAQANNTVQAAAFRQGFSCTPETLKHVPKLTGSTEFGDPDGKRVVYLNATFGSFTPTCTPSLLVFPHLSAGEATSLRPLPAAQSLMRLCQQSAGIMTDTAVSQGQLMLLNTLVSQVRSFELRLGRDALENPGLIDALLSRTAEESLCAS